jgi:MinD superfamily P-loop ATPase
MIPEADGAVIVTTPQALAIEDVRRSIKFCRTLNLPVIGVIENMSGFICPHCGKVTQVFNRGGGRKLAEETGVPFLGEIPLDPAIMNSGDDGLPFVFKYKDSETGKRFVEVIEPLLKLPDRRNFMMASH